MTLYERSDEDIDRGLVGYWKLDDLKRKASDGIIAHYKMNDNVASTDVIDSKGGNTGTASANTSTMTTAGKINTALNFTGDSTEVVEISDNPIFDFTSRFSLSFWFRLNSTTQEEFTRIIEKEGDEGSGRNGWTVIFSNSSKDIALEIHNSDSAFSVELTKTDWLVDTWYHITFTFDGSDYRGYIDDSLDVTVNNSDVVGLNNLNVIFGADDNSGASGFDGKLDDIRFYDRDISLAEVQTIDNSGNGTETTELFRDTIVAIDRKNFNDGIITGATNTTGINGLNPDAMFFDGVDDLVTVPDNSILDFGTSDFSVSCWVKSIDFTSQGEFVHKRIGTSEGWHFGYKNSAVHIDIEDTSGNQVAKDVTYGDISNEDTHFVFVVERGNEIRTYANGIFLDNEDISSVTGSVSSSANLLIGDGFANFGGSLQNMRIYNRLLTDGEASKLHRLKL